MSEANQQPQVKRAGTPMRLWTPMDFLMRSLRALKGRGGRTRVFGVGAAKTGTHSLASLFEGGSLSVDHEPNASKLIELICARPSKSLNPEAFRASMQAIIEESNTSINVSQINGYLIKDLYAVYPNAKYILTVRDAEGWVRSLLNHIVTRKLEPEDPWIAFRALRFGRGRPFRPEDRWLEAEGLYSLDSLLEYWRDHNLAVLKSIPDRQLCVVPTLQIGQHKQVIYDFVGSNHTAETAIDHAFKGVYASNPQNFPAGYVEERCAFYSDGLIRAARHVTHPRTLQVLKGAVYPKAPGDHIVSGSTDLDRWRQVASETDERWDGRAKQAATMLLDQDSVLDLGCGAMTLEGMLPKHIRYIPADCVARDERTIVCDVNVNRLPNVDTQCVTALGLFEYIYDVPSLISSLAEHFNVMVCSYIPSESVGSIKARRETGWVNDYSIGEFEHIMCEAGFSIVMKERYLDRAWIWRVESRESRAAPS